MSDFIIYPCSKSGKILKGFCPTVCTSWSDVFKTLNGWSKFSKKFGINYWFNGLDNSILPLNLNSNL